MEQTANSLERASRGGLATDDAYAQALPAILAVPSQRLVTINVDIMTVITTVLGALPKLRSLQGKMAALWSDFDVEQYDRLERHALALQEAHAVYQTTRARHPSLIPLASELVKVRDRLLGNALSLARYGLIDRQPLQALQRNAGYRRLAGDVGVLVAVYRERWGSLVGKTPVTLAELDHAAALALQLLVAVGAREHTPPAFARAARIRQQAFTLLVEAYADVRRDLRYLLGKKGDVEAVAPSLYAGRGRTESARHSTRQPKRAESVDKNPGSPVFGRGRCWFPRSRPGARLGQGHVRIPEAPAERGRALGSALRAARAIEGGDHRRRAARPAEAPPTAFANHWQALW